MFRRALTTAVAVAGLALLGPVPFAAAQQEPAGGVATGGGEPAEGAPGFLVLSGAVLAAAASGGLVLHLRRRPS